MADVVHYRLERMVNELEDLERRGIFTHGEIAEIVKQRRKFEFRLKRPSPLKKDFIAYIEYETQLERLRRLRKKALAHETKKKKKKSISDFAGVSRIVEIYRQAVMRYKGDIDLWFRYLEFCRQKKNGRMAKVLAQVLRFHPKVPGVWIYAAAWEFDHNLNVAAARALMQNGLSVCPKSEDLWVEYLRMELTYLNKLKTRKVALGEDRGSLVEDHGNDNEKQWRDQNKQLFMPLDAETGDNEGTNAKGGVTDEGSDTFREHGLNVLQSVYVGAVEALPSSFNLRRRFLEIVEAVNLAHSKELRKLFLSDMKKNFAEDPEYWDWRAKYEITNYRSSKQMDEDGFSSKWQKAIEVYEEALQVLPSSTMYDKYVKFLTDAIEQEREGCSVFTSVKDTEDFVSCLLAVYDKAEKMGCLSEELACKYVSLYIQLGRLHDAQELAKNLACGRFSDSSKLWLLRASIKLKSLATNSSASNFELQPFFELLRSALTKFAIPKAESLWLLALKFFADRKPYFEKLVEISFTSLRVNGGSDEEFSLPSAIFNFVLQKEGVDRAREMYKRYLALPRPGLALYRDCIKMEENLAALGEKGCLGNARKLYDSALATYTCNKSLWQDYYKMETKLGTSETVASVSWRARKTLKDEAAFVTAPDLL